MPQTGCTSCIGAQSVCRRDQTDTKPSLLYTQRSSAQDILISEDSPGSRCLINSVTSALLWPFVASLVFQSLLQITVSDSGSPSDTDFLVLLLYIAIMVAI